MKKCLVSARLGLALFMVFHAFAGRAFQDLRTDWFMSGAELSPPAGMDWEPEGQPRTLPLLDGGGRTGAANAIWLWRDVTLTTDDLAQDLFLHHGEAHWGATIWVNGQEIARSLLPSPGVHLLPRQILRTGTNRIVFRLNAYRDLPTGRNSRFPLTPVGQAHADWGNKASKLESVSLHRARRVHLAQVLPLPEPDASQLRVRLFPLRTPDAPNQVLVRVRIVEEVGGRVWGEHSAPLNLEPGPYGEVDFVMPLPSDLPRWSPDAPRMLRLEIQASTEGEGVLDERSFAWGFRDLGLDVGGFRVNGRLTPLLGSNLVAEWHRNAALAKDDETIRTFFIRRAKEMRVQVFRTHSHPAPEAWRTVADREGMLLILEMPNMFNWGNWRFDDDEARLYLQRAREDALRWVRALGHHPSIVMWAPTNEPAAWSAAGESELLAAVQAVDPSRPAFRTAVPNESLHDVHIYAGFHGGNEGDFGAVARKAAAGAKKEGLPLFNTEYLELWKRDRQRRWYGRESTDEEALLTYASFAAEQTELLRRLRYACVLPYMFGVWGTHVPEDRFWRPGLPSPAYAALRQALAPRHASLDLFDRNLPSDHPVRANSVTVNDHAEDAHLRLRLLLTTQNPAWGGNPEAWKDAVLLGEAEVFVPPGGQVRSPWTLRTPKDPGVYFLLLECWVDGHERILSQQEVRVAVPFPAERPPVVCLLGSQRLAEVVRGLGVAVQEQMEPGVPVLVHVEKPLPVEAEQALQAALAQGASVLLLLDGGPAPVFARELRVQAFRPGSRAFADEPGHPVFAGLTAAAFQRMNGRNGQVASRGFEWPGSRTLLRFGDPALALLAERAVGGGMLRVCSLDLDEARLDARRASFDPALTRLFLNLLIPSTTDP